MALEATSKHLKALLERIERLTDQLTRTQVRSAEVREFVRAVRRKIERGRKSLEAPGGFSSGDMPVST
jgi:predicted  nucleic acid-binding Zn-ribbon protein